MASRSIVILGAGGHGQVVRALAMRCGYEVLGFLEHEGGPSTSATQLLGTDTDIRKFQDHDFAIGFASRSLLSRRTQLAHILKQIGLKSPSLVDPDALIIESNLTADGIQVMAGASIQVDVQISSWCIINTGSIIEHGCSLAEYVHVAPGAVLCGEVHVGMGSLIGAGAVVLEGIRVGAGCTVGAGAVVTHDVADGTTVAGVPARII